MPRRLLHGSTSLEGVLQPSEEARVDIECLPTETGVEPRLHDGNDLETGVEAVEVTPMTEPNQVPKHHLIIVINHLCLVNRIFRWTCWHFLQSNNSLDPRRNLSFMEKIIEQSSPFSSTNACPSICLSVILQTQVNWIICMHNYTQQF